MKDTIIDLEKEFEIEYNEKVFNNGNDFNSFKAYSYLDENFQNIYESELIINQFKKEFLEAPKVKNYRLYKNQIVSEELVIQTINEANKMITIIDTDEVVVPHIALIDENGNEKVVPRVMLNTENEIKLMDIYKEFSLLPDIENESYYLNDITSTNVYNILFQIEQKFKLFKQNIKEPKIIASAITIILNKSNLDNSIKVEILNSLLNKNQNELISIYKITFEDWSLAKDIFNQEIYEFIKILEENKFVNSDDSQNYVENVNLEFNKNDVIKEKIDKHLNFLSENCPRMHNQILKDKDFSLFKEWNYHFYTNNFKVPKNIRRISYNTNVGYMRLCFKYLFKELFPECTVPPSLFEFYNKSLKHKTIQKNDCIQKEGNNFQLKKLMQLPDA